MEFLIHFDRIFQRLSKPLINLDPVDAAPNRIRFILERCPVDLVAEQGVHASGIRHVLFRRVEELEPLADAVVNEPGCLGKLIFACLLIGMMDKVLNTIVNPIDLGANI